MPMHKRPPAILWTRRATAKIILGLKKHRLLWDPGHREYGINEKREAAYKEILTDLRKINFEVSIAEIKSKIHTVRSQYKRQVSSILRDQKRYGVVRKPTLWSFHYLNFLWHICANGVPLPDFATEIESLDDGCNSAIDEDTASSQLPDDEIVDISYKIKDEELSETEYLNIESLSEAQDNSSDYTPSSYRSKSLVWDRKHCKILIELYKNNPVLWNPLHDGYDDSSLRDDVNVVIARELCKSLPGVTGIDVKMKLHTIRSQYRKQLRDLYSQKRSGKEMRPKLWSFNLLSFLWPICTNDEDDIPFFSGDDDIDFDAVDDEVYDNTSVYDVNTADSNKVVDNDLEDEFVEIDEYVETDDTPPDHIDTTNKRNDMKNEGKQLKPIKQQLNNMGFRNRFTWLGEQVVTTLNEMIDEDAIYETVTNIKQLLSELKRINEKENGKHNTDAAEIDDSDVEEMPHHRRYEKHRPTLADFNTFEVNYDVGLLDIDELFVKVVNNTVMIGGEHVEDSNGYVNVSGKFVRHYELPNGYDTKTIVSTLSADGILTVRAAKCVSDKRIRVIPIQRVSASNLFYDDDYKVTTRDAAKRRKYQVIS